MNSCPEPEVVGLLVDTCICSFRHLKIKKADKQKVLLHLGKCHRCAHFFTSILMTLATIETDSLPESSEDSKGKAYKILLET